MDLKGSKTEKNLQTAFAGESQAHTKYQYYASAAKKEGYNQIGAIFTETAGNHPDSRCVPDHGPLRSMFSLQVSPFLHGLAAQLAAGGVDIAAKAPPHGGGDAMGL